MTPSDIIVEEILKQLNEGISPWHKNWKECGYPRNYVSGTVYKGLNLLTLSMNECNEYITYNQAVKLKGDVQGARSYKIVFWRPYIKEITDKDGTVKKKTRFVLKYFIVFNVKDVKGIEPHDKFTVGELEFPGYPAIQSYLDNEKIRITSKAVNMPFYEVTRDEITINPIETYECEEEWYMSVLHEIVHSTKTFARCNRNTTREAEEAVAEIAAGLIASALGISYSIENLASYCAHWLANIVKLGELMPTIVKQSILASNYVLKQCIENQQK